MCNKDCLKKALEYFFREEQPDFVKKHSGYWRQAMKHHYLEKKILVTFNEKDLGGAGIGIFWRENKSITHAVVMRDGEIVFNPEDRPLGELRFFIVFKKLPPHTKRMDMSNPPHP
jgi:hypothetical protein